MSLPGVKQPVNLSYSLISRGCALKRFASVFLTTAVAVMLLLGGCGDDDPVSHQNKPPKASFVLTPRVGLVETAFEFDASGCSDEEDAATSLQVRWDWENDGTWDGSWSAAKTASHQYSTTGTKTIALEVRDTEGLTDRVTRQTQVTAAFYRGCDYFPISSGNRWEYNTGTMEVEGAEHTFVDGIGLRAELDFIFASDTSVVFLNCVAGAVAWLGAYDIADDRYTSDPITGLASILTDSMYVGAQWTLVGEEGGDVVSIGIEVIGTESVTVPAGAFDHCLRVQITLFESEQGRFYTDETYFARGVGPVKSERVSQSGPTEGWFLFVNEDYPVAQLQSASIDDIDYP